MVKCSGCKRTVGVKNSTGMCRDCYNTEWLKTYQEANVLHAKDVSELEQNLEKEGFTVALTKLEQTTASNGTCTGGKCGTCNRKVGVRKSTGLCWSCETKVAIQEAVKLGQLLMAKKLLLKYTLTNSMKLVKAEPVMHIAA